MSRIITPGGSAAAPRDDAGAPGGIQVRCPRCQTPFAAPIINVVDVKRYPQLKAALLSGELNRAACPSCGAVSALSVPLVYHDPDKELLLVLIPSELNLPPDQQQRLIGGLVQAVMSNVPAEERKSYFLRPETLLSRQRLVERILEADGVTREMLEAAEKLEFEHAAWLRDRIQQLKDAPVLVGADGREWVDPEALDNGTRKRGKGKGRRGPRGYHRKG